MSRKKLSRKKLTSKKWRDGLFHKGTFIVWLTLAASPSASATWSICAADLSNGEVAVASATCLADFDLKAATPVMVVGKGVGVAQSFLGPASLRQIIRDELMRGTDPAIILDLLEQADNSYETRQYGIVDLQGRVATHTGTQNGGWAGHRAGTVGSIVYTIQGNVLTGTPVVLDAESAFVNTNGDLRERVIAAMLAARAMGGDGRCSCNGSRPESCGSPPPFFTHSAYVSYFLMSRIGDIDGPDCNDRDGCSQGDYYLDLNVPTGNQFLPDPVFRLVDQYDAWVADRDGLPDHFRSRASFARPAMPSDGITRSPLLVELYDAEGDAITQGGATVSVVHAPNSDGITDIGTVVDNGNGTYTVELTAGDRVGVDRFAILVEVPDQRATLYPFPELRNVNPLESDTLSISSSNPQPVMFALTEPGALDQSAYLVLLSVSGTTPGFDWNGIHVPLNWDGATLISALLANRGPFLNTLGQFSLDGSGQASFAPAPSWLDLLIGNTLHFAFVSMSPVDAASNAVAIFVTP